MWVGVRTPFVCVCFCLYVCVLWGGCARHVCMEGAVCVGMLCVVCVCGRKCARHVLHAMFVCVWCVGGSVHAMFCTPCLCVWGSVHAVCRVFVWKGVCVGYVVWGCVVAVCVYV